jgi:hypothetical protein
MRLESKRKMLATCSRAQLPLNQTRKEKRGPMKLRVNAAVAAVLAASLVFANAQAGGHTPQAKKHTAAKKVQTPPAPSVEEQIQALRSELQTQIDGLKSNLSSKDAELKKAQQEAADARAAAAKTEEAAAAQQQATTDNAAAVSALQSTVKDISTSAAGIVDTLQDVQVRTAKKADLSDLAFGKVKIGATLFGDFSYWSDYDGSTTFIDNQTAPSSIADSNYNTFEITRAYINMFYTPNDDVTLRFTPDIYRVSDGSLAYRLKYAFVDLNKPFAKFKYISHDKITFGQTQEPLVDWEEGLTGHRYTYKMPIDFAGGLSSTYVGVRVRGPVEYNGKIYLDNDLGVYTNGKYNATELSANKQFMGRMSYYPLGTKVDRTGLGLTVFGNYGTTNVAPSSAAAGQYGQDRMVLMAHYQTADKAYLISGEYNLSHNIKSNGNTQEGFAAIGNARLGGKKSPLQAFGLYQYYEPYSNASNNDATRYSRTVGGIAYKFNKYLDIAITDSNLHYMKATAAAKDDTNVVSINTQYNF